MKITRIVVAAMLACVSCAVPAADSPVGVWRTVDDRSGKEKSLVRIVEVNGELRGTVERLFREPGEDPNPVCEKCTGDRKGKPVIGMTILSGLRREGTQFTGGEILDPANGKTYQCKMALSDNGKKLQVRGFIGVALLGRTQVWLRED